MGRDGCGVRKGEQILVSSVSIMNRIGVGLNPTDSSSKAATVLVFVSSLGAV